MASEDYKKKLNEMESNQPSVYQSQYGSQIGGTLDKILNREKFSYDFNADPIFKQYKDQYTKMGNEAAMNAVANASNMTGGFANSYAATAGAQANQQYLTQLNDKIPELYAAAMDRYNMDTQDLYNQYSLLSDAEKAEYAKYRDSISDFYANRDYYTNAYNTELGQENWQKTFEENVRQFGLNYALQQAQFNENIRQFDVGQENWQKQFDEGQRQFDLSYDLDVKKFNEDVRQFGLSYALENAKFDESKRQFDIGQENWQKTFDENVRQFGLNYALQQAKLSGSGSGSGSSSGSSTAADASKKVTEVTKPYTTAEKQESIAKTKAETGIGTTKADSMNTLGKNDAYDTPLGQKAVDIKNKKANYETALKEATGMLQNSKNINTLGNSLVTKVNNGQLTAAQATEILNKLS